MEHVVGPIHALQRASFHHKHVGHHGLVTIPPLHLTCHPRDPRSLELLPITLI